MSRTTIKAVWPGEKAEDYMELRNSYLWAPIAWSYLTVTHLGWEEHGWLSKLSDDWKKMTSIIRNKNVPFHHKAILVMTYDRFYIERKHFERAINDISLFVKDLGDRSSHWKTVAEAMIHLPVDVPAIGFRATSVSEDLFHGEWNKDEDDYFPLDWSIFYEVYDELKKENQDDSK